MPISLATDFNRDTLPPVTTVSLLVAQFIASQKPFMAFGNVPKAALRLSELRAPKLTLASAGNARHPSSGFVMRALNI